MTLLAVEHADAWLYCAVLVYLLTTLATSCGVMLGIRYVWSRTLSLCTCVVAVLAAVPMLLSMPWAWSAIAAAVLGTGLTGGLMQLRSMELHERCCFAMTLEGGDQVLH